MLESKLNLNFDLVEQARNHASKVADDTQRFIDRHTTVAVERTVCRLLGIDGVNAFDVPLPNVVVEHLTAKGALAQGAAFWIGNAMVETGKVPRPSPRPWPTAPWTSPPSPSTPTPTSTRPLTPWCRTP